MNLSWSKGVSAAVVCAGLAGSFPVQFLGYDYSEPMRCVPALPLGYPESPFVLRFTPEELRAQPIWSSRIDAILIARDAPAAVRTGAEVLRSTLTKQGLGDVSLVELNSSEKTLPSTLKGERVIVLGETGKFALAAALAQAAGLQVTDEALNGDGFVIKPIRQDRREILLITSPVARGVLYGAYELEERTGKRGVPRIDQPFAPAVRYRGWAMHAMCDAPLDAIGRWRLNISILHGEQTAPGLFYQEFPELGGEKARATILENQRKAHEMFANSAKYGAMQTVIWNPLSFCLAPLGGEPARRALAGAHPGILAQPDPRLQVAGDHGMNRYNLCPSDPATRRFVTSSVRELVQTYPGLERICLFLSDNGGELICGCDKCRDYPYLDRLADYTDLVRQTAREINPRIRIIFATFALNMWIPVIHPEYADDPTKGLTALKRRLGNNVEAMMMSVTSPPGADIQSWLAPESTMLNRGIPLFYLFHYYEAGGPGVVSPISSVQSHLSWALPIYLDKLRSYIHGGMIGAMSPQAGMEVAYWHPGLDAHQYMRNWCRAKYGPAAGQDVFQALVDTHKITEAFFLSGKAERSESFDLYRWGPYLKPWATDMGALVKLAPDSGFINGINTFMTPHVPQPEELRRIRPAQREQWRRRFELTEETAIAGRAETLLARAQQGNPANPEIRRLHEVARGTKALLQLFKAYHLALIDANLARNTANQADHKVYVDHARGQLRSAILAAVEYKNCYVPLMDEERVHIVWMQRHVKDFYLSAMLCIVREAACLFDREFGGESTLEFFDRQMGPGGARGP